MTKRRVALLIATDSYADEHFTDLRTPCRDAVALAGLLSDQKIGAFTVRTLTNRPVQEVRQVLDETFTDADRDDLILLHISGHGLKDESGRLHMIMSDTSRKHLRASAVAATWLRELIDHSRARRVVVWLDCCFSGAFPAGLTPKGTETVDAIDQLTGGSGRGCAVMTASTKIQYAFEKDQASVFTEAIMAGLRSGAADLNEDGFVDASELYSYAYEWVRARTPEQTPTRNDMLAGDIRIAYNPNALRLPLALAQEIRQLLRSSDPRFRQLGIKELSALARKGDEIALAALAALGEKPVAEEPEPVPAFQRPAIVVQVPPSLAQSLQPEAPPVFRLSHDLKVTSKKLLGEKKNVQLAGIAFHPGLGNIVCVASDNTVRTLYLQSGNDTSPRRKHDNDVLAVAYSPYGRLMASSTRDQIQLWRTDTSRTQQIGSGALALAFSPDNKLAAATGEGIGLWDSEGAPLGLIETDKPAWVTGVAFSPDGAHLVSSQFDGVRLWHAHSLELVRELEMPNTSDGFAEPAKAIAYSPDGRLVAAAGLHNTVRSWQVPSGSPAHATATHSRVHTIAFSPDGQILATGDDDGAVWISDPNGRWPATLLGRHVDKVVSLAFNSDGVLASASKDGQIVAWKRG